MDRDDGYGNSRFGFGIVIRRGDCAASVRLQRRNGIRGSAVVAVHAGEQVTGVAEVSEHGPQRPAEHAHIAAFGNVALVAGRQIVLENVPLAVGDHAGNFSDQRREFIAESIARIFGRTAHAPAEADLVARIEFGFGADEIKIDLRSGFDAIRKTDQAFGFDVERIAVLERECAAADSVDDMIGSILVF